MLFRAVAYLRVLLLEDAGSAPWHHQVIQEGGGTQVGSSTPWHFQTLSPLGAWAESVDGRGTSSLSLTTSKDDIDSSKKRPPLLQQEDESELSLLRALR